MLLSVAFAALIFAFSPSIAENRQKRAGFSCSNSELSDELRQFFLNYHNDARSRVAHGIEPNNVGTLNPAKNMYKLEWDCAMEQQAQESVNYCSNRYGSFPKMTQNLMSVGIDGSSNPIDKISSVLNTWWSAVRKYGVTDPGNKYTDGNIFPFANMVYSDTTKLGCAYKICGNYMSITCLYNGVPYLNQPLWETGSPCIQAEDCTGYSASTCDAGLCIKLDVPDTNYMCPNNPQMTDALRKRFLDMHNKLRSSVARGLEPDALGGYAPKAAKMLKMVYDCSVEATAIRHASKCMVQHSKEFERPGLGENFHATGFVNFDKIKIATRASQDWWDELKTYGVGPSNILSEALNNRPNTVIGHYTQMAWETSYRLGCALVNCSSFIFIICQYGPTGNYINQQIYTPGNPCTTDSECPGSYTCSAAEGLCNVV